MSIRKNISINSVLLDPENARHGDKASQREIYAWMCEGPVGQKVYKLAQEIAREGISPLETPGVIHAPEGAGKPWVVVEGNRRVAALKFLNNPKLCPDQKSKKQYERLAANAETPISKKIEFVVFENIAMARYWIETRHGGENGGAGIIDWGPREFDNFAARFGKRTSNRPAVEMLEYAYKKGLFTERDKNRKFPVTTLSRLLSSPVFRQAIGCEVVRGQLCQVANEEYFDRAVATVLEILATGQKTVTDLKSKEQREEFAEELKSNGGWAGYDELEARPLGSGAPATDGEDSDLSDDDTNDESSVTQQPKQPRGTQTPSWDRKSLFPRNKDGLPIPDDYRKAKNIVAELRRLKTGGTTGTPIAVAMLLRALIELSTNRYRDVFSVKAEQDFHRQVACVADHMKTRNFIDADQHAVVLRMSREAEGMLHVKTLQKYVHSDAFHPTADVLNSLWDQISFYIGACWRHSPNA